MNLVLVRLVVLLVYWLSAITGMRASLCRGIDERIYRYKRELAAKIDQHVWIEQMAEVTNKNLHCQYSWPSLALKAIRVDLAAAMMKFV